MALPDEFGRYDRTHGRCKPCGLVFRWKAARGTRLKDGPRCTQCRRALKQTTVAVLIGPTIVDVEAAALFVPSELA